MSSIFAELLSDHTLRTVALGATLLGITSGALGCFAMLRRQSLLGDAISHAALPGVALAFMLTGNKEPLVLLCGAALAGWLGTLAVGAITRHSRVKLDAALGLVLSVFFGIGLVLLTFIQSLPNARQAGLDKFLFGNASTLLSSDIRSMALLALVALGALALLWSRFKLLAFDPDFAASLGLPVRWLELILSTLIVLAIVIGLQTVGVVLMSAMLVAPAAAARQWTDRLLSMVLLAAGFGALAGVSGALLSASFEHLPTGPSIVLLVSLLVLVSLLFAPNRGLFFTWLRSLQQRRQLGRATVLLNLLRMAEQHSDPFHPHRLLVPGVPGRSLSLQAGDLRREGMIEPVGDGLFRLTPSGLAEARRLDESYVPGGQP